MKDRLQRVLDFAVAKEREAEAFYKEWAQRVVDPSVHALFAELAATERGHWEILRHVMPHDIVSPSAEVPPDEEIARWLVELPATTDLSIREAVDVAIRRKDAAALLYGRLERLGGETSALLHALKSEELRHRQMLEKALAPGERERQGRTASGRT